MKYFAYSQKEFLYKYIVMLSDIDQFRHMSFANYLRLMFLATDAFLMPNMGSEFTGRYRLKLRDSRTQFKRQTIAGDSILIKLNTSHVSDTDFSFFYIQMFN
jgi:acyl-CoA thioesterase FadM